MPVFKWEGKDRQGQSVKGQLEASNAAVAALQLRKQMIIPLQVKPEKEKKKVSLLDYLLDRSAETVAERIKESLELVLLRSLPRDAAIPQELTTLTVR